MTTDVAAQGVDAMTIKASGSWDAESLMHHSILNGTNGAADSSKSKRGTSRRLGRGKSVKAKDRTTSPADWGTPGDLTKAEVDCFMKFREQVEKRGGDFRDTVYCFGEEEGEAYALCRWLRARKFVYDDVITMVEEATLVRTDPKKKGFYPNPTEALGCPESLFHSQYPQLYTGNAKNGSILFISKPGLLIPDGLECITVQENILKYHWHAMIHDFGNRLRKQKEEHPEFTRFECFCVLDLEHLTTAQLSKKALGLIKEQSFIDSLCFPETMSKMVIVNAPRFFSASWMVIKGWLDARTANKVEVHSGRGAWEKRLREYIDEDVLPSDYGGKATDSNSIIQSNIAEGLVRQETHFMHVRGHNSHTIEVKKGECLEVLVQTRSAAGAAVSITDASRKETPMEVVEVKSSEDGETPSCINITKNHSRGRLMGPAHYKVKVNSHNNRLHSDSFLLVFNFYPN